MGKLRKSSKNSEPQPAAETSPAFEFHPSRAERYEMGKSLREKCPRDLHAAWQPADDRPDPIVIVVGVGSVGTMCAIILMMASDKDFLFLQVKEARPSVLEPYAGKSVHDNDGQRVVIGCQFMQSASDLFLGWGEGDLGRQFYVRQLKDMKIKMLVEVFTQSVMLQYAEACGWALAHAHARSGKPAKISGYLGKSDVFDKAIADFSAAYADQSERDHEVLMEAVRAGRLEVFMEEE